MHEVEPEFTGQLADVKIAFKCKSFRRDLNARLTEDRDLPLALFHVMIVPKRYFFNNLCESTAFLQRITVILR